MRTRTQDAIEVVRAYLLAGEQLEAVGRIRPRWARRPRGHREHRGQPAPVYPHRAIAARLPQRIGANNTGPTKQEAEEAVDSAAWAWDALTLAASALEELQHAPSDFAREEFLRAWEMLTEARSLAIRSGADDLAHAIDVLAEQAGDALEEIGTGAGDGFAAFWGLPPAGLLGGGAVVGLVAMGMALYLGPTLVATMGGAMSGYTLAMGKSVGIAAKGSAPLARELIPIKLAAK